MPSVKPTLALSTPVSANFPRDVPRDVPREIPSAVSVQTPLSARSLRDPLPSAGLPSAGLPSAGMSQTFSPTVPLSARIKNEEKTPITPPLAYLDFLRSMTLSSPPQSAKAPLNRRSTHGSTTSNSSNTSTSTVDSAVSEQEKGETPPSTAASERTDYNCKCDNAHESPKVGPINTTALPSSPSAGPKHPLSAPAAGPNFPSLAVLPSPARNKCSGRDSQTSPWSARSVRSPFDWEAALKARRQAEAPGTALITHKATTPKTSASGCGSRQSSRANVRHIREVVTRTITYTPRMAPAPKGKRRKIDHDTAIET